MFVSQSKNLAFNTFFIPKHRVSKEAGSHMLHGFSHAGFAGLGVYLRDLDADWRTEMDIELLRYYVISPDA